MSGLLHHFIAFLVSPPSASVNRRPTVVRLSRIKAHRQTLWKRLASSKICAMFTAPFPHSGSIFRNPKQFVTAKRSRESSSTIWGTYNYIVVGAGNESGIRETYLFPTCLCTECKQASLNRVPSVSRTTACTRCHQCSKAPRKLRTMARSPQNRQTNEGRSGPINNAKVATITFNSFPHREQE